jgi:hypothetical protein
VDEGEMPPWYYGLLHREARLVESERELLRVWARTAMAALEPAAPHTATR